MHRLRNVTSRVEEKDCDLTMAERGCIITSREEGGEDLNAFVNEKLQSLCERSLEQIVGDESLNMEDILRGSVDVAKVTLAKWGLCAQNCHTAVMWIEVRADCLMVMT